eukprot:6876_1
MSSLPLLFVIYLLISITLCKLPPNPPLFSWNTVPLFMHSQNKSGPLNDTAAQYMSTFPIVSIEKSQGQDPNNPYCNTTKQPCQEDIIIASLKKIKSYNPNTRGLFYLNSMINFPQYTLSTNFYGKNEKYLLHDSNGNLVYLNQCNQNAPHQTIFDLSQNITREFWLNTIEYAMTKEPDIVDGIFIDRAKSRISEELSCVNITTQKANAWDNGHIEIMKYAMNIVRKYNSDKGIIICNNADVENVNGRMFERLRQNDTHGIPNGNDLNVFMNDNGVRIVNLHEDNCQRGLSVYNQSLAVYLIGAFEYSYYGCTEGWTLQTGWDTIWENVDYFKDLGRPKFNATFDNKTQIYYREFEKGVKVWLDYLWEYPCIAWSDGTITGKESDCNKYT